LDQKELGLRLREARRQAGLTQNQAAAALGVTYQAVSNYERGKCRVEAGTLKQLCILYRISPVTLLESPEWDESRRATYASAATDADKLALFEMWGVPQDMAEEYQLLQEQQKAAASVGSGLNAEEDALLSLFRNIPQENRNLVLNMVEAALKSQGLLP